MEQLLGLQALLGALLRGRLGLDGRGLGRELDEDRGLEQGRAKQLGPALTEAGVLATTPGGHTLRLLLPYAAGEVELRELWAALARACAIAPS